jgi:L-asparaginase / beta-aspartyl-peptidase
VVEGQTLEYRAAAGLRSTKNPVKLARSMFDDAKLGLLVGPAADKLAADRGLDQVDNSYFTTTKRKTFWESRIADYHKVESHGTVGAVALDIHSNLAAANSTGGTMFKPVGRLGDTAIMGAGVYADDKIGIAW